MTASTSDTAPTLTLTNPLPPMTSARTGDGQDNWGTPRELLEVLEHLGFRFGLDVCAEPWSACAPQWISEDEDALRVPWITRVPHERPDVWCNPPYSCWSEFARRCVDQTPNLWFGSTRTCMLIFARTDTQAWHDWVMPYASELYFVRGRLRFREPPEREPGKENSAPAASVLVVYDCANMRPPGGPRCHQLGRNLHEQRLLERADELAL